MKGKIIFALLMFFSTLGMQLHAQKMKHLSLEIGGVGGVASLSFERELLQKEAFRLDLRLGFSLLPIDANNGVSLIFPVMAHGVLGKSRHQLDLGIGQAFTLTTKGNFFVLMPLSFGYRFSPGEGKIYLRPAYTPLVSYLLDLQIQHWAGLTVGFRL